MPYLRECIESIKIQSEPKWELIAVDDSSTDDCFHILKNMSSEDSRIKVIKNPGVGIIHALRHALNNSIGDYITRMDADDIMYPDKLKALLECISSSDQNALAIGRVEYFSEGQLGKGYLAYAKWLNDLCDSRTHQKEQFKECVIPSPSWMCHRDFLLSCGAFDESRYPEDYDLCFRFLRQNPKIKSTETVVHKWRDHSTRASRNLDEYKDNRFLEIKIHYFLKDHYIPEKPLFIWGAGTSGKQIAKALIEEDVKFKWLTNNPKKIGHNVYGQTLKDSDITDLSESQIIIRIGNPKALTQVKKHLEENFPSAKAYYFC